jgi:hypothetical protein
VAGRLRVALPKSGGEGGFARLSDTREKNFSESDVRLDDPETIDSMEAFESVGRQVIEPGKQSAFRALMQPMEEQASTFKPDGRGKSERSPDFYRLFINGNHSPKTVQRFAASKSRLIQGRKNSLSGPVFLSSR